MNQDFQSFAKNNRPPVFGKRFYILVVLVTIIILSVLVYLFRDQIKTMVKLPRETDTAVSTPENENSARGIPMNRSNVGIISGLIRPMSVIKNAHDDLYVCDFGDHSVKVYDSSNKFVKKIGSFGTSPGKFDRPHAVDFNAEGQFYVTEYGNRRIQIFSPEGTYISTLETPRELIGPATAYFDQEYNLYVSDYGSGSVDKYSKEGKFLGWIGAKEDGTLTSGWEISQEPSVQSTVPGGFQKVHTVKFDQQRTMYAIDTWNHRIQRFSEDGKFTGWIGAKEDGTLTNGWEMAGVAQKSALPGGFDAPIALDFINGDELVILEFGNPRIQRFSNTGNFIGWFGGTEDGGYTGGWEKSGQALASDRLGAFNGAYDLRIYGNIMYIADTGNKRIEVIEFLE